MVAAVDQIVHRVDDGQARTYVRFEKVFYIAFASGIFQQLVNFLLRGGRELVGCHDGDVIVQQLFVKHCDFLARGAIDKDGVENIHPDNLIVQCFGRGGGTLCL